MSYKLFLVNTIVLIIVLIIAFFSPVLDPEMKYSIFGAFALTIVFGISIAGIILGVINMRAQRNSKKNSIGFYGNLTYCLLIFIIMATTIYTML